MDKKTALDAIQKMHETNTVTRESIIGWYNCYAHKLPKMHPERSEEDLLHTISLWMELTDEGGRPPFPFQYKSAIEFQSINPTKPARFSILFLVGNGISLSGLVLLIFNWQIALALLIGGQIVDYVGYKMAGGSSNPELIKEGTVRFENEQRVLKWISQQKI